jgi:lipoprotein-anchoring transpeptidase ErfK/SrfK
MQKRASAALAIIALTGAAAVLVLLAQNNTIFTTANAAQLPTNAARTQQAPAQAQAQAQAAKIQTLEAGANTPAVLALNKRLVALHFLLTVGGSTYGPATTDAVIAFQKWEGLPRDGVDGPQTQARLLTATPPQPLLHESGKRVEVSLSKQVALEVDNGSVLWVIPVSTGRPGLATPIGRFHVFSKFLASWSVPYQEWMPYASYFTSGIALHGLASVPVYPGSHGCVRVPLEFAPILYQFDTIGTEVDVLP